MFPHVCPMRALRRSGDGAHEHLVGLQTWDPERAYIEFMDRFLRTSCDAR